MSQKISNMKIIVRFILFLLIIGALLFVPADTLNWPDAWFYLIIYFSYAMALLLWLRKNNPELLKERSTFLKKSAKGWDKIIILVATILFIAMFSITGFDAVRYRWSQIPFFLKVLGYTGLIYSFCLIFSVMKENTYLSRTVEIQRDRGHSVITTGPYKYVRHPMYVGVIIIFFCTPIALGSLYAFIPATLLSILVIIRTYLEDKMLQRELPGYIEYTKKTPYRLLPGVW